MDETQQRAPQHSIYPGSYIGKIGADGTNGSHTKSMLRVSEY